jgi:predicted GIY-YIG superfamily endonuclease
MALVQRLPYNPDAIDIAAIQRREQLKIWHRQKPEELAERRPFWREWLPRR